MTYGYEEPPRGGSGWTHFTKAGAGMIRVALLFGSVGIALALLLVPVLERRTNQMADNGIGVDNMATGSVGSRDRTYTIRRSVFQPSPNAVCIISNEGTRHGAC